MSSGVGIKLVASVGALTAGIAAVVLIVDLLRSVFG